MSWFGPTSLVAFPPVMVGPIAKIFVQLLLSEGTMPS